MEKKRSNIRDLAKAAGLSAGTVSRILNNRPGDMKILETTRARVVELARKMEYVPNIHAQRLFSKRSGVIGLIIPSAERNGSPVFGCTHLSHVLAGMERELDATFRRLELHPAGRRRRDAARAPGRPSPPPARQQRRRRRGNRRQRRIPAAPDSA